MSIRHHQYTGYRYFSLLVALFFLLVPCTGTWAQGKGPQVEAPSPKGAAKGIEVVVQHGRLTVSLQEADLGEVLAQIGKQAEIRISSGPSSGKKVSARFASIELEEGLRRLLRLASLSHIFLYANGPGGTLTIAEVRVLGEGKDTTPSQATSAEPRLQENEPSAAPSVGRARRSAPTVVEPVQESAPEVTGGEPSELTRRVREVFQLSKGMGNKPPDGQQSSPTDAK
jgi:hypothetical protein